MLLWFDNGFYSVRENEVVGVLSASRQMLFKFQGFLKPGESVDLFVAIRAVHML
jgi:hypothetical protein